MQVGKHKFCSHYKLKRCEVFYNPKPLIRDDLRLQFLCYKFLTLSCKYLSVICKMRLCNLEFGFIRFYSEISFSDWDWYLCGYFWILKLIGLFLETTHLRGHSSLNHMTFYRSFSTFVLFIVFKYFNQTSLQSYVDHYLVL